MRVLMLLLGVLCAGCVSFPAAQDKIVLRSWNVLVHGRVAIPAGEGVTPPADAPDYFSVSGRFAGEGARRNETLMSLPAVGGAPALPMRGQPLQGVSAIQWNADGTLWALSDNGYGNRANSADAMLMIHRLRIDWDTGAVARLDTVFLSDPNRVAPFPILSETSETRYLTGRDFDPESFAPRPGGGFFVGEEFGPFVLEFDAAGRLLALYPVSSQGVEVRSPDHWAGGAANLGRSKGLEGMGHSADGRFIYPMLEGPILDAAGQPERDGQGRTILRIFEFEVATRAFTGREWLYPLSDPGHAIGDILFTDDSSAIVIERDGLQGDAAQVKRLVHITLSPEGGAVTQSTVWDLLTMTHGGETLRFPFVTIESITRTGDGQFIIANDNNYPFSAGRDPTRPDNTEFVLVGLGL